MSVSFSASLEEDQKIVLHILSEIFGAPLAWSSAEVNFRQNINQAIAIAYLEGRGHSTLLNMLLAGAFKVRQPQEPVVTAVILSKTWGQHLSFFESEALLTEVSADKIAGIPVSLLRKLYPDVMQLGPHHASFKENFAWYRNVLLSDKHSLMLSDVITANGGWDQLIFTWVKPPLTDAQYVKSYYYTSQITRVFVNNVMRSVRWKHSNGIQGIQGNFGADGMFEGLQNLSRAFAGDNIFGAGTFLEDFRCKWFPILHEFRQQTQSDFKDEELIVSWDGQ